MGVERAPERPMTPREELLRLRAPSTAAAIQRGVQEWRTNPGGAADRLYGERMIQKLCGFHAQAPAAVDGAYGVLEASLKNTADAFPDKLEAIRDRLKEPPPAYGDAPERSLHPYIRYNEERQPQTDPDEPNPDPLPRYSIDDATVLADIDYLNELGKGFPERSAERAAVARLVDQLNAYRLLDPRTAMREAQASIEGGRSTMDAAGMDMGRVALTGVLASITAIFGTISIVQFIRSGGKEISFAPLLWGFATLFVADPKLVTSFFKPNDPILKEFKEFGVVTNDRGIQYLAKKHGIGGVGWSKTVQRIYDGDHDNLHTLADPSPEAKARIAKQLAGGDAAVERELAAMMDSDDGRGKNDFAMFVETLTRVKGEGARDFIATYVEKDSIREGIRQDPATVAAIRNIERARLEAKKA